MRHALFRKTKSEPEAAAAPTADKAEGKGRPTPSRKEAEAARKERLKANLDTKAAARADRDKRASARRKAMDGMKAGDEKYLMPRDKGPVRRYIRDWVDSRLSFVQLAVPIMILILALPVLGVSPVLVSNVWMTVFLVMILEMLWLVVSLRRDLAKRFPDESRRGTTFYMLMRAIQMRFMRMPKPQVGFRGRKS